MSLRRMMRNARRATNYNLAAQLPETKAPEQDLFAKCGLADIFLDDAPKPRLADQKYRKDGHGDNEA